MFEHAKAKISLKPLCLKHFACKNQTHHLVLHILSPVMKLKVVSFFLGRDRLGETSSLSLGREREPETEPECNPGPPAAAVHHPLTVQHHAHEGETQRKGETVREDRKRLTHTLVICLRRRMKTCAAGYSSWSSPCSSAPSSCPTWRDRANRVSGGEGRS